MPEYRIIETRPATMCWEFIVEANNQTEALNKVIDGEVNPTEHWSEEEVEESSYQIVDSNE